MRLDQVIAASALALFGAAHAADPACSAYSGPHTTALVELYTSEGCDSCPAADLWLSSLFAQGFRPDQVVPLALHVDYWDYMGWKDPFAKGEFSIRQRKLAQMKRPVTVYTPQVLVQGPSMPVQRSLSWSTKPSLARHLLPCMISLLCRPETLNREQPP